MIRGATGWMDTAKCANRGNGHFFSDYENEQAVALRLCAQCPVQQQCLEYALTGEERHGIWGGLTPRQRFQLLAGRPVMNRCAGCGELYTTERGTSHRSSYCTKECRNTSIRRSDLARKHVEHRPCLVCGTETIGSDVCSAYCRFVYRRMTLRKTSQQ